MDRRLRFPNQTLPPNPLYLYLLLAMRTPRPIPIAVPTMKEVIPTQAVGLMIGAPRGGIGIGAIFV